ncbi:MAG: DUF6600 domain-containing protein [Flavitalea sp.]
MKKLNILLIALITFTGTLVSKPAAAQDGNENGYNDPNFSNFYNELTPYGRWVNMPRYGQVWIYNEPGFRPYSTNGQWINTNQGWSWESDYEWGAIPFHYGRWELDPYYGWIWIPGYQYAPAWVMWSQADDYYGWAPLGFGMDINISIGRIPTNRWMYAQRGYMGYKRIDNYCVPYQRNSFYYQRQRPVVNIFTNRNVRYSGGPRYDNRNNNYSRAPVRTEQYGNNGERGSGPVNRPNNNIHYDPSQYRRESALGGHRPDRPISVPQSQERPNIEQRREYSPAPHAPASRPEISRPAPRTYNDAPARNSEPRINNNQPRQSAPVERERNNSNGGGRPSMERNRSIH